MIGPNSIVILYLKEPREKVWGLLLSLDQAGVVVRGISLDSFDDWCHELAKGESQFLGLSEVFYPYTRVEKIQLDEEGGSSPSFSERFRKIVGKDVREFLGS